MESVKNVENAKIVIVNEEIEETEENVSDVEVVHQEKEKTGKISQ